MTDGKESWAGWQTERGRKEATRERDRELKG